MTQADDKDVRVFNICVLIYITCLCVCACITL